MKVYAVKYENDFCNLNLNQGFEFCNLLNASLYETEEDAEEGIENVREYSDFLDNKIVQIVPIKMDEITT